MPGLICRLPGASAWLANGWVACRLILPPTRFSASPTSVRRRAPLVGQHTREVLAEAGLAETEIARLEVAGVLSEGLGAGGTRAAAG